MAQPSSTPAQEQNLPKIILQTIATFVIMVLMFGGLLCLIAGTYSYWQAWVYAVVFSLGTSSQGMYLAIKDPALLERRKKIATEGESTAEKVFIILGLLSNLILLAVAGLDRRFGWSYMPASVSLIGDGLVALSFVIYLIVFRENSYAASSIKVFDGQKVISTGLYGMIRHPKYVGDLFLMIGATLALGSWWGLAIIASTISGLVWRILDEEKLLKQDLPGYTEYTQQVRWRPVPGLW